MSFLPNYFPKMCCISLDRYFLILALVCCIKYGVCYERKARSAGHSRHSNIPSKPHIVFILADDLGNATYDAFFKVFNIYSYVSLGYNDVPWNNPDVTAPNLNRLKEKSTLIDNYYTDRLCNPSRAALMTGYYHDTNRMMGLNAVTAGGLPADIKLMPGYMKDLGYSTHLIGKYATLLNCSSNNNIIAFCFAKMAPWILQQEVLADEERIR